MLGNVSWQLNGSRAVLCCGELAAVLDARRPQQGVHDLDWRGRRLADARLLSLVLDPAEGDSLVDVYQRGGDLIVRYAQTAKRPFAVQAYWRASLTPIGGHHFPRCDLLVSVETQLLDSRPVVDAMSGFTQPDGIVEGPHHFVARLANSELSYIEVHHPDDSLKASVAADESGVRLTTRLFGQPLEKGVILRSRLRGLLVPREDDEAIAQRALEDFVALPPPLTT